jgi:hypothetical protein
MNQPVTMSLDVARGHVKLPLEPAADDEVLTNQFTLTNSNGSFSMASDADSVARVGVSPGSATVNLLNDSTLDDDLNFKLRVGVQSELRVPTLVIDLRDTPELIPRWLKMDIGSRYTTANLTSQYPPGILDQILVGYTETIDATTWKVALTGAPFDPWRVAVAAADVGDTGEFIGRADTDDGGTVLASPLTKKATGAADTLSITIASGPLWTTVADNYPSDIDVEGERMTALSASGASSPQTLTVLRAINGVVKAHAAGASVSLWNPPRAGL